MCLLAIPLMARVEFATQRKNICTALQLECHGRSAISGTIRVYKSQQLLMSSDRQLRLGLG